MKREVTISATWGLVTTLVLGVLILVGSRNLAHFDAALAAYTASVLFATFGLTYRYVMWLQRPSTAVYWKHGWQTFVKRGHRTHNLRSWVSHLVNDFLINRFILARDKMRGITHLLIMWGCIIAIAITFPLVFGWLHFESIPDDLSLYQAYVFGFPTFTFPVDSVFAFFAFHGLVWSSFIVIAGVMLAMRRRMREEGAAALQRFAEDFLPLILLFAVSLSGLMLTASYTWMRGYAYEFIAIFHAVTVIITFLWLPFGKFFHIFQRPAQLGVRFYKEVGQREEAALCRRCGQPFSSLMHITDLIQVEQKLGYNYEIPGSDVAHYQWICPPCRRATLAQAQGQLWQVARGGTAVYPISIAPPTTPTYVNPGLGEGPLGEEDARNFHA
jgi:nitrate reductase gamma subunit